MALRVNDIQRGHALFSGGVGGQFNEAFLCQQKQRARLVGVVSRDQDGCVSSNVRNRGNTIAVEAERLIVDLGSSDEIRAVGSVEAVQIRGVLEVVRIERAVSQGLVGQHIVVVDHDLEVIALGSQRVLNLLENFSVRSGGSANLQHLKLAIGGSSSIGGGGGVVGSGLTLGSAAGKRGDEQQGGKNDCKYLFHDKISFCYF